MFHGRPAKFLVAAVVLFVGYFLRHRNTTKFGLPLKSNTVITDVVFNATFLATNDLHSAFDGIGVISYPENITGGYSKLIRLIRYIRSKKSAAGDTVLTLDAGDWYSGSLYDNIAADSRTRSIPQLEFFAAAGYDAIVLGNHEFDRYEAALYTMFEKSAALGLQINILVSNMKPLSDESKFQKFFNSDSAVKFLPYLIKEGKHGKIGILGYIAPDALFVSDDYRSDLQFVGYSKSEGQQYDKLVELARQQSEDLKMNHHCDIIVVVVHGGHKDKEDVGLLKLPFVNVVLGGHSHEKYLYSTPDSSLTSQCGNAGMSLTALSTTLAADGRLVFRGVDDEFENSVEASSPQCIKITHKFQVDEGFEQKITEWNQEIDNLFDIDQRKVVYHGDLSEIYVTSNSDRRNAELFSHMLINQYNKWEKDVKGATEPVYVMFWNQEFLEYDEVTQPTTNIILTLGDVYNMIFYTATKDIHVCYIRKEDVYYAIQGIFIVQNTVSPLMSITAGGIVYEETDFYGIPVITNLRTISGVPYAEWPPLIRILTNSVSARYLWKAGKYSYGFLDNFARDQEGKLITFEQSLIPDAPKEFDLFLNYLKESNSVPS